MNELINKDYLNDLKEYGKDFSIQNLKYMSQFASKISIDEIRQQPAAQIPWGTLTNTIIYKSKSHDEMLWYINKTERND